jgi:hypothetical protein
MYSSQNQMAYPRSHTPGLQPQQGEIERDTEQSRRKSVARVKAVVFALRLPLGRRTSARVKVDVRVGTADGRAGRDGDAGLARHRRLRPHLGFGKLALASACVFAARGNRGFGRTDDTVEDEVVNAAAAAADGCFLSASSSAAGRFRRFQPASSNSDKATQTKIN